MAQFYTNFGSTAYNTTPLGWVVTGGFMLRRGSRSELTVQARPNTGHGAAYWEEAGRATERDIAVRFSMNWSNHSFSVYPRFEAGRAIEGWGARYRRGGTLELIRRVTTTGTPEVLQTVQIGSDVSNGFIRVQYSAGMLRAKVWSDSNWTNEPPNWQAEVAVDLGGVGPDYAALQTEETNGALLYLVSVATEGDTLLKAPPRVRYALNLDAIEENAEELPGWDVVNTDPGDPLQVRVQTINGQKRLVVWGTGLLLAPVPASWDHELYWRGTFTPAFEKMRVAVRVDLADPEYRYELALTQTAAVAYRRQPGNLVQLSSNPATVTVGSLYGFRGNTLNDSVRIRHYVENLEDPPKEQGWAVSSYSATFRGGRVGLVFTAVTEADPIVLDAVGVSLHGGYAPKRAPEVWFTDFSDIPEGEALQDHGWTLQYSSGNGSLVRQADGGVKLTGSAAAYTWDVVPPRSWLEVLLKFRVASSVGTTTNLCEVMFAFDGPSTWLTESLAIRGAQVQGILRGTWNSQSPLTAYGIQNLSNKTWFARITNDPDDGWLFKVWEEGTPEPKEALHVGSAPTLGRIGLRPHHSGVTFLQFSVATEGGIAPMEPRGAAPAQRAEATDAAAAGWGGMQPEAEASVLVPDAGPQRFYTDFSTDQLGAPPAGWVWGVGAPAEVVVEAVGGRTAMKVDTWEPDVDLAQNKVLVWNAVPDASDVEVVARIFAPVRDGSDGPFVALRINPEKSTGYIARIEGDDLWIEALDGAQWPAYRFGSYNIGVYPDDEWIWIRFRAEGSTLKAKAWPDGTPEPAGWQLEFTDTFYTTGAVGVGAYAYDGYWEDEGITQVYFYVSNFGVGTEGAQAPAAQPLYYVNFSGHPTGQAPGGAVVTWDPNGTAQFQVVATDSISGRAVKRVDAGSPAALYFTAYGDYVTDADVVARVRLNQEPNIQGGEMPVGIVLRGRPGNAGNGYLLSWYGSLLTLSVLVNGMHTGGASATTAGTTEDWYWLRFRADGNLLRAKVWPADGKTPEPSEWAIEFEDQTHAAGFIGFANQFSNTAEVDAVAIGTYGQRAPAVVPAWRLDMDTLQARGDGPAATNHGTVLEWDPAIGPVRVFDGQSWVELEPADSMTAGAEDVAVVMWWRLSNVEGDPLVLYAEAADDVVQFGLTTEEFRTESTAGSHVMPVPALTTDQWLCVAATYSTSRGDKAVYVNGQRVAQALGMTAPLTADRDVIRLGFGVDMSAMQAAQGRLAIVERYDQPLDRADVLALYIAERARFLGQTQPAQTATAAPVAAPWAQHDAEATPGGRTATAEVTGWTPQAADAEAETGPPPQRAAAEVVEAGWGVAQPQAQGVPGGRTATAAGAAGVAWGETGARDATAASAITVEAIDPAETEPEAYTATAVPGPVWAEAEDVPEAPWSVPDGWAGTGSTPQQAEADALVAPWQGIDAEATPGRAATEAEAVAPWWAIPAPEVLASVSATATDSASADSQVHDARALPGAAAAGTDPAAVEPKAWSADASAQVTASGPAPTWAAGAHDTEAEPGPVTADAEPAPGQPQARDAEAMGGDPTDQQAIADTPPSWQVFVPVAAAVALAVLATATAPAVATAAAHDGEGAPGVRKAEAQAAQGFGAAVDAVSLPGARKGEAVPATAWTPTAWDAPASSRTIAPALAASGEPVVYLATGVAGLVTVEAEAGVVPWLAWDGEWVDVTYLPPVIIEAPLRVIDVAVLARPLPVTGFAAVPVPLPLYSTAQGGGGAPKVLQSVRLPAGGNGLTLRVPLEIPDSIVVTSSIEAELEAGHEGKVGYIPSVAGVEGDRETGYFVDFVVGKNDMLADATTHRCRVFLRFPGGKVLVTDPFLVEVIA